MTIEFILPDIGEGIVECELLEWLVSEGEHIEEDNIPSLSHGKGKARATFGSQWRNGLGENFSESAGVNAP